MKNFNRGNRFNDRRGGGDFAGRDQKRGFNRGGGRPVMHQAICDACKQNCEVPFKPSGDKPIFCNTCFSKQGGGASRSHRFNSDRRESQRPRFEDRGGSQSNQDSQEILKGIKTLNYKLDELIKALGSKAPAKGTEKTKEVKTTSKKKVAKKKTVKKSAKNKKE